MSIKSVIPVHIRLVNGASSAFVSSIVSAVGGGGVGWLTGKPKAYAMQATLTALFSRYIAPNTIGKVFMHANSNNAAQCIGFTIKLVTQVFIPYKLTNYLTDKIPFLKDDENQLFSARHAFVASLIGSWAASVHGEHSF